MSDLVPCCPHCRGSLNREREALRCAACQKSFPIVAGIPDLRVCADPYIDFAHDRAKALRLAEDGRTRGFAALLERYYEITPEVPADLARHYCSHNLAGVERGEAVLQRLQAYGAELTDRSGPTHLDLGCGTAGFVAAAAMRGVSVVGVDIALRWLVVARRRLDELGFGGSRLVCACADHLPFPDSSCAVITAEFLLEHAASPIGVLREVRRVGGPETFFMARTVNRFALAPEPHVGVWGVGFLPRRLMDPYVRARKGIPYEHVRTESFLGLRRLLRETGSRNLEVRRPLLTAGDVAQQPLSRRRLLACWAALDRWMPPARPLLALFGPFLDVVTRAGVRPAPDRR